MYFAIGGSFYVIVYRNRTYFICGNKSRLWVLDIRNTSFDFSVHCAVFKGAVAIWSKGTIFQNKIMRVTQWLFTRNMAVYQT